MRRDTARSPPRELPTGQGWPPCLQFCFALSTEPSRASSHARPSARTATAESSRTSSRARPQPATVGLDDHVLSAPPERAFADEHQQPQSPHARQVARVLRHVQQPQSPHARQVARVLNLPQSASTVTFSQHRPNVLSPTNKPPAEAGVPDQPAIGASPSLTDQTTIRSSCAYSHPPYEPGQTATGLSQANSLTTASPNPYDSHSQQHPCELSHTNSISTAPPSPDDHVLSAPPERAFADERHR